METTEVQQPQHKRGIWLVVGLGVLLVVLVVVGWRLGRRSTSVSLPSGSFEEQVVTEGKISVSSEHPRFDVERTELYSDLAKVVKEVGLWKQGVVRGSESVDRVTASGLRIVLTDQVQVGDRLTNPQGQVMSSMGYNVENGVVTMRIQVDEEAIKAAELSIDDVFNTALLRGVYFLITNEPGGFDEHLQAALQWVSNVYADPYLLLVGKSSWLRFPVIPKAYAQTDCERWQCGTPTYQLYCTSPDIPCSVSSDCAVGATCTRNVEVSCAPAYWEGDSPTCRNPGGDCPGGQCATNYGCYCATPPFSPTPGGGEPPPSDPHTNLYGEHWGDGGYGVAVERMPPCQAFGKGWDANHQNGTEVNIYDTYAGPGDGLYLTSVIANLASVIGINTNCGNGNPGCGFLSDITGLLVPDSWSSIRTKMCDTETGECDTLLWSPRIMRCRTPESSISVSATQVTVGQPVTVSLMGTENKYGSHPVIGFVARQNHTQMSPVPAGTTQVGPYSGRYYYQLNTAQCNASNMSFCSSPNQSLTLPAGNYYFHTQSEQAADVWNGPWKCSGNPVCNYESINPTPIPGQTTCGDWRSCSDEDNAFLRVVTPTPTRTPTPTLTPTRTPTPVANTPTPTPYVQGFVRNQAYGAMIAGRCITT